MHATINEPVGNNLYMTEQSKLKKELTFLDVFCLATGAMISSGLFVLPGIAHAKVGPALFLAYLFAGLLALTGLLSQAELVSAMPKSGGAYFFVTRSLGPAVGTIQGLLTWLSLLLKAAFALVGISAFVALIFPSLSASLDVVPWVGILVAFLFISLNLLGAKKAGRAQSYLVFFLMGSLLVYGVASVDHIQVTNFSPFAPYGFDAVFMISGYIFVSYGGLLKVASVAEEVKRAEHVIPRAMIASLVVVTLFYSIIVLITTGVLGAEKLDGSLTPISLGARETMGTSGFVVLSLAAIASFITTANAGLMAASRYPMALSRDKLLPEFLQRLHPKMQTPVASIIISGAVLIVSLFLKLDILVELASTVLILTFLFAHLSVLILRESRVMNYQPTFKSPFYPWVQIVGTVLFLLILLKMSQEVLYIKLILIGMAFIIYWFYGRIRTEQKFALLHIIERLTAKELVTGQLENELKEIIQERDEIVKDRFDHMIENCRVLDINEPIKADQLFEIAAEKIAEDLNCRKEVVELSLIKREHESTTALNYDVAIPHVVVEGEKIFNVVLVRCRHGIYFSEDYPEINAVFILYGSKDERTYHLRALSAIAQIVSDPKFDHKWLMAKNVQALKDTILLGPRKRIP